jgi:hypothetical protein
MLNSNYAARNRFRQIGLLAVDLRRRRSLFDRFGWYCDTISTEKGKQNRDAAFIGSDLFAAVANAHLGLALLANEPSFLK